MLPVARGRSSNLDRLTATNDTDDPAAPPPLRRRLAPLALAVLPVLGAVVSLSAAWRFPVTVGDTAWLTQRVADVVGGRWPLVGMPSSIGRGDLATHHPGPLQFYWLAPWWAAAGFQGILVGTAVGSAVALGWLGAVVRWLPGATTLAAVGVQTAAVVGILTVGPETLADPWNPYAALPWAVLFLAGVVAAWTGERRGWWAVVAAGTVTMQLHAGFVPWVLVFAVALGVLAWREADRRPDRRLLGRLGLLGLVLWSPALVDLVVGDHNPVLLARASIGGSAEGAGVAPVVVAGAAALNPAHAHIDAPWLPNSPTAVEVLVVVGVLGLAALSWWVAPREHWSRRWVAVCGAAWVLWALLATRALPFQGFLPVAYTRMLWPVGAVLWFGMGAAWWARRPAAWPAATVALPVAATVLWALSVPRGYVGIDPATRVRAAEVVDDLRDAGLPDTAAGVNVTARGFLGGWWIAPTVTAELDRRGVDNGVGTNRDWDVESMTDRPRPLPGTECTFVVGDVEADGPVLAPARGLDRAEQRRLEELRRRLAVRYARLEPSRVAREQAEDGTPEPALQRPVEALLESGEFADLAVQGRVEGLDLRDGDVAEYVELAHRADPGWSGVSVWSQSC